MIVTPRPSLYLLTEAALAAAAARVAEVAKPGGLAPAAATERQDRHGSNLDGRPQRGGMVETRRQGPAANGAGETAFQPSTARLHAATGYYAHLLAQAAPRHHGALTVAGPTAGHANAAYRSAQALQRRAEPEGYEIFGPYPAPTGMRGFDLQV